MQILLHSRDKCILEALLDQSESFGNIEAHTSFEDWRLACAEDQRKPIGVFREKAETFLLLNGTFGVTLNTQILPEHSNRNTQIYGNSSDQTCLLFESEINTRSGFGK